MQTYRSEFPVTEKYAYLNHAAIAPMSRRVAQATAAFSSGCTTDGIANFPRWMEKVRQVRGSFGKLIHAEAEEVAFVGNTSEGLSAVAGGLRWREGEKVFVPEPEFPANIYPWMNLRVQGVEVVFVKRREGRLDVTDLEKALSPGARLVCISSVDFSTGYACDLMALGDFCRRKGLLFCVDAIQGLGVLPVDVKACGIHFLSSGAHKWLLGPMGCGGLFISKEVNDLVRPGRVGWKSVENEEDFFRIHFELKTAAERFEPGTLNLMGIYALGAALEMIQEVGIASIREKILGLNDRLAEGLRERGLRVVTPLGEGERSGILSFDPEGDAAALFRHLLAKKVMVSERSGLIRLSPHFYNDGKDLEAFFEALDRF